ncbi:MAG: nicotinamide-nucleotide amidohydrolase family protein [Burkholderiales bacterium]|nr:nicotinamide-nucleotide amidohydrolase family protein [Burkholderiales bacterium]
MPDPGFHRLAEAVGAALKARGLMLATAESCTGGWIAEVVTMVAGSSEWFERGFVTYTDVSKREMLGVREATLAACGAVAEPVVVEMAEGALARSRAQVAVAVSGVAGPGGGTPEKPVGTVCIAWASRDGAPRAETFRFPGDREAVRRQSVERALDGVLELLGAGAARARAPGPAETDAGYADRVRCLHDALGVPADFFAGRNLPLQPEAQDLEIVETGVNGREYLLAPAAAAAWRRMRDAAAADGVTLTIASAFRSVGRQAEIVREKLAAGIGLDAIFAASAPPGYSEHHTGRAVDVSTPGARAFEADFEDTPAFRWLQANAGRFGFVLSYPPGNACGYDYEPWHWCHHPS